MSIKFHCEHCGKKIEASDGTGGKWAKCPACHNKVYIPDIKPDDELKLSPVDQVEEERKRHLLNETFQLTQSILQESNSPENASIPSPVTEISEELLTQTIIRYLRQMADGDLDKAHVTADMIAPHRRKSREILEQIVDGTVGGPELRDVPPQVLAGLIRNLRTRLS